MHIVIIEWDGQVPPTAYYERLRKMALKVRTQDINHRGLSPIVRRMGGADDDKGKGVIVQEGCIVTSSLSQAKYVANLATIYGATVVQIGEVELDSYHATDADKHAFARVERVFGRRGRPPQEQSWLITCIEEMQAYQIDKPEVAICPGCGGNRIKARALGGEGVIPVSYPKDSDPLRAWIATRFHTGGFELPVIRDNAPAAKVDLDNVKNEIERKVAGLLCDSPSALKLNDESLFSFENTLYLYDAMFAGRVFFHKNDRKNARLRAITKFLGEGGSSDISIAESVDLDPFDAAVILGTDRAAGYAKVVV